MFTSGKIRILVLSSLIVLALSAAFVNPALADGETPPPAPEATVVSGEGTPLEASPTETPATEEAAPATEATLIAEAALTEEAAPTEDAPTQEAAPTVEVTEVPASDQVTTIEPAPAEGESQTTADLLAGLPEGTDLVAVNAAGDAVSLASEEAAEIIAINDPIWCPSGVAPKPGVGGCSPTKSSITELVTSYPNGFPSNGTIWVQYGAAVGGIIDGSGAWAARSIYSLTIQGGWEGTPGSTALHTADPYSYFSGFDNFLKITNWVGSVTLKNLIFQSVTVDVGDIFNAVHIVTKGNIRLDKVQVNDAINNNASFNGHGAMLDNTSGTGTIIVTNSSFNNNEGNGLHIYSNNIITLTNVSAYHNVFYGVFAGNHTAASAKAVSVSNSTFTDNGWDGLLVYSKGAITLNNITANSNGNDGAELRNDYGSTAAPIYVNGVNTFNSNPGSGLYAVSKGLIKVSNTTANSNATIGVALINQSSPFSVGVTISGYLNALYNTLGGLNITSTGTVTAANLNTSFNPADGTYINNTYWCPPPSFVCIPKNVTISGTNIFNRNGGEGLEIQSRGTVLLNNLSASRNGNIFYNDGVAINNAYDPAKQMAVTINGYNTFSDNEDFGLNITSFGMVTLSNINAVENGESGVEVDNKGGTYAKAVNLKGVNSFNGNVSDGIRIFSDGAITVSNIIANDNHGGAWLENNGPVQANVTISGYGVFYGNGSIGLRVESQGAISLTNITANFNGDNGADLNTVGLTSTHAVTLNGVNNFNYNGDGLTESGLIINADGAIKVSNITANFNSGDGAWLDNDNSLMAQASVTITGYGVFEGNGYEGGLTVTSHGAISLTNITANSNFGNGADLNTIGLTSTHAVTLYGVNSFNNNGLGGAGTGGLIINADGTITAYNITATYNRYFGAILNNYTNWVANGFSGFGSVKVIGYGTFVNTYYGDGLNVRTHGSITLNRVVADFNSFNGLVGGGIDLQAGGNITLVCSSAYGNAGIGLLASTPGTLTLKGFLAYWNTGGNESLGYAFLVRTTCP